MRGRPWSWITGRPRLTDGLVVGFCAFFGLVGVPGAYIRFGRIAGWVAVLVLVQAAALWWRRSRPLIVLAVVTAAVLAQWLLLSSSEPSAVALPFAVYALSVYGQPNVRLWVAGIAIALIAVAVGSLIFDKFSISRATILIAAPSLIAWVIGDYIRSRRSSFRDLVARHRQERDRAAEEERLRIARELHDVVAHNVSAIAIQAGAARISGESNPETLESIERSARDTLAELNRLLGVLRKSRGEPHLAPQPGLNEVETLLKPAREAGLDVTLEVRGEERSLPAALDLSAYRIVQEAVTNVLKHANATRLEVNIDYEPDALEVAISDNGSGAPQPLADSTGHGLVGMRERVDIFGGVLTTGSSPLGGFSVRARLPVNG